MNNSFFAELSASYPHDEFKTGGTKMRIERGFVLSMEHSGKSINTRATQLSTVESLLVNPSSMKTSLRSLALLLSGYEFSRVLAQGTAASSAALSQSTLPVGSCTADIPCSNGACCNSKSGYCGFGDSFCKTVAAGGPCTSNCDAKAQCGPNAPAGQEECPLQVCCSEFGFCGTTEDFCGTGCLSNCNPAQPARCDANQQSALQRRIGYYEGWASARSCDAWTPSTMMVDVLTHVNFAFAYISDSFEVIEMTPGDSKLWTETTALKGKNPALKVFLSIGGWTFNNPPTSGIFSALAASSANTNKFIKSVLNVMNAYGFDGIDIDWEYPVAEDRGGTPGDKANYPTFLKAIKKAFTPYGYELSFTAPSSYWYLQNYDLPKLLADGAADWVNVMTYDLHGVWDSPADYIGSIVLAHTNLTQIEMTFQLYATVGIDPSKIVMGLGFYGRSFELSSADCSDPGCPFAGAAPAGPCSANAGTLMFSEIEDIIASVGNDQLVFDEAAAVKYLVYNTKDWVSYDDQQTLDMKLQYANGICLSGTMVWSLDQDDTSYTALSALWGDAVTSDASSSITRDACTYTGCGLSCPKDSTILGKLQKNPQTLEVCQDPDVSLICCPVGDAPQSCTWKGASPSGQCNGSCDEGEILMGLSQIGDGTGAVHIPGESFPAIGLTCLTGELALCCKSNEDTRNYCFATDCDVTTCPPGSKAFTSVLVGDAELEFCSSGIGRTLCCEDNIGLTNCKWHGTLPNCLDNACPVGQTVIWSDFQGDASSSCLGANQRNYCCDTPNAATFSPVDENDVFPSSETVGDAITFTVDYDDNQGTANEKTTGDGSSGLSDDGKENDSPFSSLFISSPNAASVSSLDIDSDWALAACDPASDRAQSVLAYCTCPITDENCGCAHVFIGGAADTVVKLPPSCGQGPYARLVSLEVNHDQTLLPERHLRQRSAGPVYSLAFDYAFTEISVDKGPIYMRADMTDMPGYWDSIIDSPPDDSSSVRKRNLDFHQPRGLEKRWFGSFKAWLAKLNKLTQADSISRNYHWSDTYTIFHQEESCANFQSSLDVSVSGYASINSQFGYYLEATIVPPAVQQAYVYFKAGAGAEAAFTITGIAAASWDSGRYELVNFGFPGLYYPGLLTLGPSLHLYGELSGQLSLSGTFKATVSYTFPNLDLSFGKQDTDASESNFGTPVAPTDNFHNVKSEVGWNVQLSGAADVHLIPSLQLGVSVLGGSLINAQVFVEADLFAGLSIEGSVSKAVALDACITPEIGVNLNAGLTGSVLYWETGPLSTPFYAEKLSLEPTCLSSVTEPAGGSPGTGRKRSHIGSASAAGESRNTSASPQSGPTRSFNQSMVAFEPPRAVVPHGRNIHSTSGWQRQGGRGKVSDINKRAIPFLPGNLFCPATDSDITSAATNCDPYANHATTLSRRNLLGSNRTTKHAQEAVQPLSKRAADGASLKTCDGYSIPIAPYKSLDPNAFFDLASPAILDGAIRGYANVPPYYSYKTSKGAPAMVAAQSGAVIYGREHVYEQSMSSLFIDYLHQFPEVWNVSGVRNFCTWAHSNLWTVPPYMPAGSRAVVEDIGLCYPSLANSRAAGIPVLEQNANIDKNSAFYYPERALDPGLKDEPSIVNEDDFASECPTLQVARLRTIAMITPFMNSLPARDAFEQTNDCIRGVYQDWYPKYAASVNNVVPLPAGFISEYNAWVKVIVSGLRPAVITEMDTLIPLYNNKLTTPTEVKLTTNPVLTEWANLSPRPAAGAAWVPTKNLNTATINANLISVQNVSRADLQTLRNNVPDITWISTLP